MIKFRDSAHCVPEAVDAEFGLDGRTYDEMRSAAQICIPLGIYPVFRPFMGHLKGLEEIICIFVHSTYPILLK